MKQFFFACGTRDAVASSGILAMRVMTGLMMLIGHGIPKIQNFSNLKDSFRTFDFFPLQWMSSTVSLSACIAAEAGAAILITLGLATRPAAFVLGFTMVVAAFAVHGDSVWFLGQGITAAKEPAILYIIPMIGLILTGAGSFSLDALLDRERKSRLKLSL